MKGNVIVDNANVSASVPLKDYFPANFIVPSLDRIGFINYRSGDWKLKADSAIRRRATDGKNPGVDFAQLDASGLHLVESGGAQ
jgi:hypothetical protein